MTPRLALVTEGLDPRRGGAERAVRATAAALAQLGHPVDVYAPADRAGPPLPLPARLHPVPVRGGRARRAWEVATALPERARADGATHVVACGKLRHADVYWPHGGVHRAARAAQSAAGRRWPALHGWARRLRPVEAVFDRIEQEAFAACAAGRARWIALSHRVARDAPVPPVAVVGNGVDPARVAAPDAAARARARAALRERLGVGPDVPVFVSVGHAWRLKGLDVAIAALPEGACLAVAGRGRPGPFRRAAQRRGARVEWLGSVEAIAEVYHGATALVHPTRYDPCSLVVLEALAAELPVVVSSRDGAAEQVGAGGWVLDEEAPVEAWSRRLTVIAAGETPPGIESVPSWLETARALWDAVCGGG